MSNTNKLSFFNIHILRREISRRCCFWVREIVLHFIKSLKSLKSLRSLRSLGTLGALRTLTISVNGLCAMRRRPIAQQAAWRITAAEAGGGKFPPLCFPSSRSAEYQTIGNISNIGSIGLPNNTLNGETLHFLFLFYPLYLYYLFYYNYCGGKSPAACFIRHREDLQPFSAMIPATDHASLWRSAFVEKRCQYPTIIHNGRLPRRCAPRNDGISDPSLRSG